MEPTISKDIPMPSLTRARAKIRPLLAQLEIGDSFVWPSDWNLNSLNSSAKLMGIKTARRTIIEKGKKVVRVWRVL